MNFLKSFFTSFLANLFGGTKPSRVEVITAALNTTVGALADHALKTQVKADDHAAEIAELDAKRTALINEAAEAAKIAANIGALLK